MLSYRPDVSFAKAIKLLAFVFPSHSSQTVGVVTAEWGVEVRVQVGVAAVDGGGV